MKGLGTNIRSLRKSRGLTLTEVAKRTGIDAATLSRIENGKMTGTLQSHMAIAKALEVRLPDLYESVIETQARPSNGRGRPEPPEVFSHSGGAVSELLTSNILQKKLMPVRLRLGAQGRTAAEEFPLGTERFVYVLEGHLEVVIKGSPHPIEEGQSLYFNASLPHHFVNKLKTPCSCLVITSPVSL
jgi:transcriptional regulator with XRE-family HTH domain